MPVNFINADSPFRLKNKRKIKAWILSEIKLQNQVPGDINIIFCSDEYLLEVNKKYLRHDYYTDIITFPNQENENKTGGDLMISVDRIKENSTDFGVAFEEELLRVIIHGILHLLGFGDKTEQEIKSMRNAENVSLNRFPVE